MLQSAPQSKLLVKQLRSLPARPQSQMPAKKPLRRMLVNQLDATSVNDTSANHESNTGVRPGLLNVSKPLSAEGF